MVSDCPLACKHLNEFLNEDKKNLPTLKNDTNNIIVYKNDLEEFKKKRKKRLWEKLITN